MQSPQRSSQDAAKLFSPRGGRRSSCWSSGREKPAPPRWPTTWPWDRHLLLDRPSVRKELLGGVPRQLQAPPGEMRTSPAPSRLRASAQERGPSESRDAQRLPATLCERRIGLAGVGVAAPSAARGQGGADGARPLGAAWPASRPPVEEGADHGPPALLRLERAEGRGDARGEADAEVEEPAQGASRQSWSRRLRGALPAELTSTGLWRCLSRRLSRCLFEGLLSFFILRIWNPSL